MLVDNHLPAELQIAGSIRYASCYHISSHAGKLYIFGAQFTLLAIVTPEEAITFFLNPPAHGSPPPPTYATPDDLLSSLVLL